MGRREAPRRVVRGRRRVRAGGRRPPARTPETPSSRCQGERFARAESARGSTAGRPRRAVAGGEGTISCAGSNRVRERDLDVLSRITRGRRTIASSIPPSSHGPTGWRARAAERLHRSSLSSPTERRSPYLGRGFRAIPGIRTAPAPALRHQPSGYEVAVSCWSRSVRLEPIRPRLRTPQFCRPRPWWVRRERLFPPQMPGVNGI